MGGWEVRLANGDEVDRIFLDAAAVDHGYRSSMNPLEVGDHLASIAVFFVTMVVGVVGLINSRSRWQRSERRVARVRAAWAIRNTVALLALFFSIWLAVSFDDLDYLFLFFVGLAWVNVGDLAGRALRLWTNGPPPPDGLERYRRADWISRWIWLVASIILAASLAGVEIAYMTSAAQVFQIWLFCMGSWLVGFVPYHIEIHSRLKSQATENGTQHRER